MRWRLAEDTVGGAPRHGQHDSDNPAMGNRHSGACDGLGPLADTRRQLRIAFATGRNGFPAIVLARAVPGRIAPCHLIEVEALPFAEADLHQCRLKNNVIECQAKRIEHQCHCFTRARQGAGHPRRFGKLRVLIDQLLEATAIAARLIAAQPVQRDIPLTLQFTGLVPVGLAMPDQNQRVSELKQLDRPCIFVGQAVDLRASAPIGRRHIGSVDRLHPNDVITRIHVMDFTGHAASQV